MEDDQQFCLRWNNHQSTLIQNFDTLLESGTLVDCTLAAEGKYLKAHKVVLSACSPYFEVRINRYYYYILFVSIESNERERQRQRTKRGSNQYQIQSLSLSLSDVATRWRRGNAFPHFPDTVKHQRLEGRGWGGFDPLSPLDQYRETKMADFQGFTHSLRRCPWGF